MFCNYLRFQFNPHYHLCEKHETSLKYIYIFINIILCYLIIFTKIISLSNNVKIFNHTTPIINYIQNSISFHVLGAFDRVSFVFGVI